MKILQAENFPFFYFFKDILTRNLLFHALSADQGDIFIKKSKSSIPGIALSAFPAHSGFGYRIIFQKICQIKLNLHHLMICFQKLIHIFERFFPDRSSITCKVAGLGFPGIQVSENGLTVLRILVLLPVNLHQFFMPFQFIPPAGMLFICKIKNFILYK